MGSLDRSSGIEKNLHGPGRWKFSDGIHDRRTLKNGDLDVRYGPGSGKPDQSYPGHLDAFDVNRNGNTTEVRNWTIGDIFHSSAVVVGSPSSSFEDVGYSGYGGFYQSKSARTKVILVGANDGMLHAFNADDRERRNGPTFRMVC